jgi:UDP-N-acetyl-D-mannosaminuronic acid dehydrogenase
MVGLTMCNRLQPEDEADAYLICVGTPVVDDGALERATREVADHMRDDALVIVRSTVRVGTTRKVVKPILEASGKRFDLAYCPERTVEGNALEELRTLPQISAADDFRTRWRAYEVFEHLGVLCSQAFSFEAGEAAKLLANAWRSVTFAFSNEVALLAEEDGFSAREAIAVANFNYPRCQIPAPGPVGGPCLPKDVKLLTLPQMRGGYSVLHASAVLNSPAVIATSIARAIDARGVGGSIAVLGTAFKGLPETDDTRDSPGLRIAALLATNYANITTIDPVAPADQCKFYPDDAFDVIVVVTNHPFWRETALDERLLVDGFIYDCCGAVAASPRVVRWGG